MADMFCSKFFVWFRHNLITILTFSGSGSRFIKAKTWIGITFSFQVIFGYFFIFRPCMTSGINFWQYCYILYGLVYIISFYQKSIWIEITSYKRHRNQHVSRNCHTKHNKTIKLQNKKKIIKRWWGYNTEI